MKLVTATLGTALLLVALGSGVGRVQAGPLPSGPCCVCTVCEFSEHCFTGLTPTESVRCGELCSGVSCSAGAIHAQACETFSPLCEVITPAPARSAPAMRPGVLVLAALGTAVVGVRRLVRRRSSKPGAA